MREVRRHQAPSLSASLLQIASSLGGFLAVCAAMYWLAAESYWLALLLAPLAAGFLIRTFIVQHDCGHGSFFRSSRANSLLGHICSLATCAPYLAWRRQHSAHHGDWNNLDRREGVDIFANCLTVDEYLAMSPWQRRLCRWGRSPFVANVLLPPVLFMVLYRFPIDLKKTWRAERRSVHLTTLAVLALGATLAVFLGWERVLAVQLPVLAIASIVGVWLFTVQHRAEHIHWSRKETWDAKTAALNGATHLRLPRLLQWFTGNIGLHHVHHLNPRIPNYRLQACHDAVPQCQTGPDFGMRAAFRSMAFTLWDERAQRMTTFKGAAANEFARSAEAGPEAARGAIG